MSEKFEITDYTPMTLMEFIVLEVRENDEICYVISDIIQDIQSILSISLTEDIDIENLRRICDLIDGCYNSHIAEFFERLHDFKVCVIRRSDEYLTESLRADPTVCPVCNEELYLSDVYMSEIKDGNLSADCANCNFEFVVYMHGFDIEPN